MSTQIQGIMCMPGTGKYQIIMPDHARDFTLRLKDGVSWKLGIDQSTSCTGLALKSSDQKYLVLLDVIRDKNMLKEDYFRDLRGVITRTTKDRVFTLVANEKPVPRKFAHARETLTELLGRLNTWIEDNPAFDGATHEAVFPQTWKSMVVDKSKGPNRSNIKREVASDLVDRYPELQHYFDFYHTSDYDSFDALGILDGTIEHAFTPDGYPKIHGTIEKTHTALALYKWYDWDSDFSYEENLAAAFGDMAQVFQPVILRYNPRYTLNENVRLCSSAYTSVITVLDGVDLVPFQWKYGIDINEAGKKMILIALKMGAFSGGAISALKSYYPMNEEVYPD